MDALPEFALVHPRTLDEVDRGARLESRKPIARRRHRSGGEHPPRHRRAAAAHRCQRRGRIARHQGRRARPRNRRVRHAQPNSPRIPMWCGTIRWWRRRPPTSPARPIATWARSAAIFVSIRAASSTIRANGGARANDHCLKTTGTICHVAPKSRGVCFATFSGDLAPALLVLDAEIDIAGSGRAADHAARRSLYRLCAAG